MSTSAGDRAIVHPEGAWRDLADYLVAARFQAPDGTERWEQLWARSVGSGRYQLCSIPFFAYGLTLGDIVTLDSDGAVQDVVLDGGQRGYRVMLGDDQDGSSLHSDLIALGAFHEAFSARLLAFSVPNVLAATVEEVLRKAMSSLSFEWETTR
jgi:hypothetical protein